MRPRTKARPAKRIPPKETSPAVDLSGKWIYTLMMTSMHISRERYFVIHTPDRPGILAQIGAELMKAAVDCTGIWGMTPEPGRGTVTVVPRSPAKFKAVADSASWSVSEGICFMLEGHDKTGALVDIFNQLAQDGISIQMLDAIAVDQRFACHFWVGDDEIEHVAQVLGLSTPKP